MKTNHKRLLLGLVTAAVLLPGSASAAPLTAMSNHQAAAAPAVEPVSLDEAEPAAGTKPAKTKPAKVKKEHRNRQAALEKTEQTVSHGTKSFLERLRDSLRGHSHKVSQPETTPAVKPEAKPDQTQAPAKTETPAKPEKPAKPAKPEKQALPVDYTKLGPADPDSLVIRNGLISVTGENLQLPSYYNPDKLLKLENQDRAVNDPSLKIIINALTTTANLWNLPANYQQEPIAGPGEVTRDQAVTLLRRYNQNLPIKATPEQIVDLYYQEAGREGLRWDVVFCQALLETGFFHFGGTVVPEQNNFCGLGTTSATERGAYFATPRDGVRAHVQHLMAYTTDRLPQTPVIDPRYYLVYKPKLQTHSFYTTWSQLNGKWATGSYYAEKILNLHEQMKQIVAISSYDWDGGLLK
ncbi:glucosaminidase domain-containing protein [Acidaminococcus timonensis]|uniref:glucosaminidase domain-containing protein n=1 Tax=Acidaminococcus timonensis TaxID=1871002 RepID=UPI0025F3907F|nr:glucosaminidase domain-containing protein [Acidaminococcus timonensis]